MTDLNALIERLRSFDREKGDDPVVIYEAADALERQNNALKIIAEQGGDALAAWEKLQAELVEERRKFEVAREVAIAVSDYDISGDDIDVRIAARMKEKGCER